MIPMNDSCALLNISCVIPIHDIFPRLIPVSIIASAALIAQRFNIEGNGLIPTLEYVLQNVTIFKLHMRKIYHACQWVGRLIRDKLHELFSDIRQVQTVFLSHERISIKTQESLHSFTNSQTRIVDYLQQQQMSGVHLVVVFVYEEAQLSPRRLSSFSCYSLQDVPNISTTSDQYVYRLVAIRHWEFFRDFFARNSISFHLCNDSFVDFLRCNFILVFLLLVNAAWRGSMSCWAESSCLHVTEEVERRRHSPELQESNGITAI
mmetsp:Transcript_114710/g.180602  ORF Transcript_114710/g.180602 Transcript_114710/m.180602 type:complete len:263 (-) Transcript_114710:126-914(-)